MNEEGAVIFETGVEVTKNTERYPETKAVQHHNKSHDAESETLNFT